MIKLTSSAKNLRVTFDSAMSMEKHVNLLCRSCYVQIRNTGQIRPLLNTEATKSLVHSLITSRLDYWNSLLCGVAEDLTSKLQRTQNAAARLITRTCKYEHITPLRMKLHWLSVKYWIKYKILMLTFQSLNSWAPRYLSNSFQQYKPKWTLRSSGSNSLVVARTRTVSYGDKAFLSVAGLWNEIPSDIKDCVNLDTFTKHLKTYLFTMAYNEWYTIMFWLCKVLLSVICHD